jgi:hypothetical protein
VIALWFIERCIVVQLLLVEDTEVWAAVHLQSLRLFKYLISEGVLVVLRGHVLLRSSRQILVKLPRLLVRLLGSLEVALDYLGTDRLRIGSLLHLELRGSRPLNLRGVQITLVLPQLSLKSVVRTDNRSLLLHEVESLIESPVIPPHQVRNHRRCRTRHSSSTVHENAAPLQPFADELECFAPNSLDVRTLDVEDVISLPLYLK